MYLEEKIVVIFQSNVTAITCNRGFMKFKKKTNGCRNKKSVTLSRCLSACYKRLKSSSIIYTVL